MEIENNVVEEVQVGQQAQQEQPKEKLFTEQEVNEFLSKRIGKEKAKLEKQYEEKYQKERSQAEKLAQMSESERQAEVLKQEREAFENERKAWEQEKMKVQLERELTQRSLPTEFADLLVDRSSEDALQTINAISKAFNDAVEKAVKAQIGQQAPKASESQGERLLTFEEISKLSREEYARNRDLVNRSLQALNK